MTHLLDEREDAEQRAWGIADYVPDPPQAAEADDESRLPAGERSYDPGSLS
jgi:hypothetical protein